MSTTENYTWVNLYYYFAEENSLSDVEPPVSVGKAVQTTVQKVRKVAEEFPVISHHSSSSCTASSK
jgi:hypothetical protein